MKRDAPRCGARRPGRDERRPVCAGGRGRPDSEVRALGFPNPAAARWPGSGLARGRGGGRPRPSPAVFLQQSPPVPLDRAALPGEGAATALVDGVALQPLPRGSGRLVLPPAGDRRGRVVERGVGGRGGGARRGSAGAWSSGCPPGQNLAAARGRRRRGDRTGSRPDALALGFGDSAVLTRVPRAKDSAQLATRTRVGGGAERRSVGTGSLPNP